MFPQVTIYLAMSCAAVEIDVSDPLVSRRDVVLGEGIAPAQRFLHG